jgi:hypothetical protein
MALTSLEVIAEKLKEKRDTELESILSISGSSAIAKNEYGITVVEDTNVASSLLFKPLTKMKMDEEELIKAIDVNVKELMPNIPKPKKDLVPKPLYDEEVQKVEDLRREVERLNLIQIELTSIINELEAQVTNLTNEKLVLEQINDLLVNQLNTTTGTITDFATQISTSLQKSVDESILRASLQSQNTGFQAQIKALIKQIDSLNSIIEGLQSQLGAVQQQQAIQQGTQAQAMAAGADVVNDVVIAKLSKKEDKDKSVICGKINAKGGNKWVNGESINFTNNDKQSVTITITTNATQGIQWFYPAQTSFELAAGAQQEIKLNINEAAAANVDSKGGKSYSHSANYKGGGMKVSVKRSDGSEKEKTYPAEFDKMHPSSY